VSKVLEDRLILLLNDLPDHLVVLDRAEPEVRNADLALKIFNIYSLDFLFLGGFITLLGLLLGEFLSVMSLELCE
jgi:hypothetical protein